MSNFTTMFVEKIDCLIERIFILFVCLWGNWALYYLVLVLFFDASFNDLKICFPFLLAQLLVSLGLLWRTDLAIVQSYTLARAGLVRSIKPPLNSRFLALLVVVTVCALVVVGSVAHFNFSSTLSVYNVVWVLLLPVFLIFAFRNKPPDTVLERLTDRAPVREHTLAAHLDALLLLACAVVLAAALYGTGLATPDDAYYGHVMSAVLANPDVPVLGSDLLFGTDAPFTLHPAYRPVGYEVLIALLGSVLAVNPVELNFRIMPVPNAVFWVLASYLFIRSLGTKFPGTAVASSVIVLLFWNEGFSPGHNLFYMFWGKSLLALIGAPMLWTLVAAFIARRSARVWGLLLLAVAATVTWSSSSLFFTPACMGLAFLVFIHSLLRGVKTACYLAAALAPILVALGYTMWMLFHAPIPGTGLNEGILRVQGEAFGGIGLQILMLLLLPLLILLSRTLDNVTFERRIYRICMIGYFTVMTPFLLEFLALALDTNFLARRLYYAFPSTLLLGLLVSITLTLWTGGVWQQVKRTRLAVTAIVLVFFGALFSCMSIKFLFGERWARTVVYSLDYSEAEAARALIPDDALVLAGDIDDLLPIFPDPPTFIYVRHYLGFYQHFLDEGEYRQRARMFSMLTLRAPAMNQDRQAALNELVAATDNLEITTIVFQMPGGRQRAPALSQDFGGWSIVSEETQQEFVDALLKRLSAEGFDCLATASGRTRVCNRQRPGKPIQQSEADSSRWVGKHNGFSTT